MQSYNHNSITVSKFIYIYCKIVIYGKYGLHLVRSTFKKKYLLAKKSLLLLKEIIFKCCLVISLSKSRDNYYLMIFKKKIALRTDYDLFFIFTIIQFKFHIFCYLPIKSQKIRYHNHFQI